MGNRNLKKRTQWQKDHISICERTQREFRSGVSAYSDHHRLKYQSESSQPIPEDHQRMNQLEDMLESVLKEDGFATLALVSTGEDLREWTYYTKSETEFMARLNYALAGVPTFPIEIHTAIRSRLGRVRAIQSRA
jgi:hypothetical protein